METTLVFEKKSQWVEQVLAFATAVGKTPEEIEKAIITVVGEPSDDALALLADSENATVELLKDAFKDLAIPPAKFNGHLQKLRGKPAVVEAAISAATPNTFDAVLPNVPDDESFIIALKTGGELKVNPTSVLSAIKAAIADKLGFFNLPKSIKEKMEKFAESIDEPVSPEFFKLQKLVTTRNYADVLNALGVEGQFMNDARQNAFLKKLDVNLWGSLKSFYDQLVQYQNAWMTGVSNPAAMMAVIAMGQAGANMGGVLPPGMMSPPDTAGLHDEAEAVVNSINKVFAGVGVPVANALGYEATRIKQVLENPALPPSLGVINRDQMLKSLGVAVGADYVRLERNITRFTLAIMEFPNITDPNKESAYIAAMMQIGATISWDKLGLSSGIGRNL